MSSVANGTGKERPEAASHRVHRVRSVTVERQSRLWSLAPALLALAVTLAVMLPFWIIPGQLFLLDMIFPPYSDLLRSATGLDEFRPAYVSGITPVNALVALMSYLTNPSVAQKLVLSLALAVLGAWSFLGRYQVSPPSRALAALFYAINPFVFLRFFAGHWKILLAYGALPPAIKAFLDFLASGSRRDMAKLAFWMWCVGLLSVHLLLLAVLVDAVLLWAHLMSANLRSTVVKRVPGLLLASLVVAVASAYWLVPAVTATSVAEVMGGRDLEAFSSRPSSRWGIPLDTLLLSGFWTQTIGDPFAVYSEWLLLALTGFLLFVVVHGGITLWSRQRYLVLGLAALGLLGLFLAAGSSGPWGPVNRVLFQHIPGLLGFRDTHKFGVLLVLVYTILLAVGFQSLFRLARPAWPSRALVAVAVAGVLLIPGGVLASFYRQQAEAKPTDYPQGWYQVREYLDAQGRDYKVLFLPWHGYMSMSWNAPRFLNPADVFFSQQVIKGENFELPGIYSQSTDPVQDYITFLLDHRDRYQNFGELVAPLGVRYVILAKEVDYARYAFLDQQEDLSKVLENDRLVVYENLYQAPRVYAAGGVVPISGWEELLERSQREDITQSIYLLPENQPASLPQAGGQGGATPLPWRLSFSLTRVAYHVEDPGRHVYVALADSFSPDWSLDGASHLANFGVTNVFVVTNPRPELEVTYRRYHAAYLPGYVASAIGVLVMVGLATPLGPAWRLLRRPRALLEQMAAIGAPLVRARRRSSAG